MLAELPLYIREDEAPELYKMSAEDGVEVGPFTVRAAVVLGAPAAVCVVPAAHGAVGAGRAVGGSMEVGPLTVWPACVNGSSVACARCSAAACPPMCRRRCQPPRCALSCLQGAGLQLRGPIAAVFRYPTIVMFAEVGGRGVCAVPPCGGAAGRAVVQCCLAMGRQGGQLGLMPTISHHLSHGRAGLAHKVWPRRSGLEGPAPEGPVQKLQLKGAWL